MGVGNWKFKSKNWSLWAKWLWHFPQEPNSLWLKVINNIHGSGRDVADAIAGRSITYHSRTIHTYIAKGFWKLHIPSKVNVFTWRTMHQKLNASEMLQIRCPHWAVFLDVYVMCFGSGKSQSHLFFCCEIAWKMCTKLYIMFGTNWVTPSTVESFLYIHKGRLGRKKVKPLRRGEPFFQPMDTRAWKELDSLWGWMYIRHMDPSLI